MRYLELKIQASEQGVEQITALLLGMGITEMSIDDPHDMDDILQKKHEYGWDYIEDDLKENLDREPVISLYFDEADPKAQQMAVMVKGGISALQRRQQAGEFIVIGGSDYLLDFSRFITHGDVKHGSQSFIRGCKKHVFNGTPYGCEEIERALFLRLKQRALALAEEGQD